MKPGKKIKWAGMTKRVSAASDHQWASESALVNNFESGPISRVSTSVKKPLGPLLVRVDRSDACTHPNTDEEISQKNKESLGYSLMSRTDACPPVRKLKICE